jgi:hypothetical protein
MPTHHVWANVEFVANDGSINELDALVLTPSGLYVVELKHWQGDIAGDGTQWAHRAPNGRLQPEDNPYILTNRKAKRLASLIRHYTKGQAPYVSAVVFLHAQLMRSKLDEVGRQHVYGLDSHPVSNLPSLKQFLLAHPRNPNWLISPERGRQIVDMVRAAKIRPSVKNRKVGQLLLLPKPFDEGNGWQDYLAGHTMDTTQFRRVRFYLTSRASDEELPAIRRAAEREFRLGESRASGRQPDRPRRHGGRTLVDLGGVPCQRHARGDTVRGGGSAAPVQRPSDPAARRCHALDVAGGHERRGDPAMPSRRQRKGTGRVEVQRCPAQATRHGHIGRTARRSRQRDACAVRTGSVLQSVDRSGPTELARLVAELARAHAVALDVIDHDRGEEVVLDRPDAPALLLFVLADPVSRRWGSVKVSW